MFPVVTRFYLTLYSQELIMDKHQISKLAVATFVATKKGLSHTLLLCSLVTMLAAPVTVANAGFLDKAMQDKLGIMTNSTSARAFESASRHVISGGSIYARNKIFNRDFISFTPPGFAAGCGGIDLFLGSFSFINKDQLVQLFRSIAQNAVGYLFMLAINTISELIGVNMKWFQELVQKINNLLSNSCQLARGLVDGGIDAIKGNIENNKSLNEYGTQAGDIFETMKNPPFLNSNNTNTGAAVSTNEDGTNDTSSNMGNLVAKSLNKLKMNSIFSLDKKTKIGDIMSVIGTPIISQNAINNHQAASTDDGKNATDSTFNFTNRGSKISLIDLVEEDGTDNPLEGYRCDSDECMNPTETTTDLNKGYMYHQVMKKLCGAQGSTYNTDCNTGIIQALQTPDKLGITSDDRNFFTSLPHGIYVYFYTLATKDVQLTGTNGYAKMYAEKVAHSIATYMAGEMLLDIVNNIRKGSAGLDLDGTSKDNFEKYLRDTETTIINDMNTLYTKYKNIAQLSDDGERWAAEQASHAEYPKLPETNATK